MSPLEELDAIESMNNLISSTAYAVSRKFRGFVDAADIAQALWEWALKPSHKRKMARWREDNDDKGYDRVLGHTLYDEGNIFARKAKAAKLGYNVNDEFFYTKALIEELLPSVYASDMWVHPPTNHDAGKSGKALNEGNNWVTTLADVGAALKKLSEDDRYVLYARYGDRRLLADLGAEFDISKRGVTHRTEAAIKRLWNHLGGPKWHQPDNEDERLDRGDNYVGRRHVMSNAEAQSITRKQWDA